MYTHLHWTRGHLLCVLLLLGAFAIQATADVIASPLNENTTVSIKVRVNSDKTYCASQGGTFTATDKPATGDTAAHTLTKCETPGGNFDYCLHFETRFECFSVIVPNQERRDITTPEDFLGDNPIDDAPDVVTRDSADQVDESQLGLADLTPAPVTPEPRPTIVPGSNLHD